MNSKSKTPETKFHGGRKRFQIINTNSPFKSPFPILITSIQQQAFILIYGRKSHKPKDCRDIALIKSTQINGMKPQMPCFTDMEWWCIGLLR